MVERRKNSLLFKCFSLFFQIRLENFWNVLGPSLGKILTLLSRDRELPIYHILLLFSYNTILLVNEIVIYILKDDFVLNCLNIWVFFFETSLNNQKKFLIKNWVLIIRTKKMSRYYFFIFGFSLSKFISIAKGIFKIFIKFSADPIAIFC